MEHIGGNGRTRVTDKNVEDVCLLFEKNPRLSIRQAESLLNISDQRYSEFYATVCNCTHTRCKTCMKSQIRAR